MIYINKTNLFIK